MDKTEKLFSVKATLPSLLGSLLRPGCGWGLRCSGYSTFLSEWGSCKHTFHKPAPHTSCRLLWLLYSFDTHDRLPSIQMKYNLQNVRMAGRKKKTYTFFCVPPPISGCMRTLPWRRECSFEKKLSGPRTNVCKGEHSARQKTLCRLRVALEGSVACHCAAFTVPIWLQTVPAWVQLCTKWRTSIHPPPTSPTNLCF